MDLPKIKEQEWKKTKNKHIYLFIEPQRKVYKNQIIVF